MPIIVEPVSSSAPALPAVTAPGPTTIDEAIQQTALGPRRVQSGNTAVDAQEIGALIEADKYVGRKAAIATGKLPIAFAQFVTGPDK